MVVGIVQSGLKLENSVVSSIQVGLGVTQSQVQGIVLTLKQLVAVSKISIHVLQIGVIAGEQVVVILKSVVVGEHLAVDHVDVRGNDVWHHNWSWGGHDWSLDRDLWDDGGWHGDLWDDSVNHWSNNVGGVGHARDVKAWSKDRGGEELSWSSHCKL